MWWDRAVVREEMHSLIQEEEKGDVMPLKQLVLLAVRGAEQSVCYHTVPFLLLVIKVNAFIYQSTHKYNYYTKGWSQGS